MPLLIFYFHRYEAWAKKESVMDIKCSSCRSAGIGIEAQESQRVAAVVSLWPRWRPGEVLKNHETVALAVVTEVSSCTCEQLRDWRQTDTTVSWTRVRMLGEQVGNGLMSLKWVQVMRRGCEQVEPILSIWPAWHTHNQTGRDSQHTGKKEAETQERWRQTASWHRVSFVLLFLCF